MKPYVRAPPPLIAARMSFALESRTPLISARIDFRDEFDTTRPAVPTIQEEFVVLPQPDAKLSTVGHTSAAESQKAPKPNGEPGRPGSGGYNLETTLLGWKGWSKVLYNEILSEVHKEADIFLDKTSSIRGQDQAKVNRICEKMAVKWTFLNDFDNCWPIRDMLKLHLKYTSEAARRAKDKAMTERVKSVVDTA